MSTVVRQLEIVQSTVYSDTTNLHNMQRSRAFKSILWLQHKGEQFLSLIENGLISM